MEKVGENEAYGTFGNSSIQYAAGRKGFPVPTLEFILSQITCRDPLLLDLGCGTGIATRQLGTRVRQVSGCDPDIRMILKALQERCEGVTYSLGNAECIPWSAGTFDAITCFSSFHWFDTDRALNEIWRVLRNGGVVAIVNKEDVGGLREAYRVFVQKYTNKILPDIKKTYQPFGSLIRNGFADVRDDFVQVVEQYTLDEAMDYLQSISLWNLIPRHLKVTAREELRTFCYSRTHSGVFERHIVVTTVTGRKIVH